jgi:hypothetical protein
MGGELRTGLGQALLSKGLDVTGRETRGEFKDFSFTDQVQVVSEDLLNHFWTSNSFLIANSFGAYLFLHAQAKLMPYPGKVLLLSPIVGGFSDEKTGRSFSPPHEHKLLELAEAGYFPRLSQCEVHTGEDDWQSHPISVRKFFNALDVVVNIVPSRGHQLGEDYVGPLLDRWLATKN